MIVVMANGCFDPLHAGHAAHLNEARRLGDLLVVALTTDEVVRADKGENRPFVPWGERAEMLLELRCVNQVVRSQTCIDALEFVKPDIFVKGIDYLGTGLPSAVVEACKRLGVRITYTQTPKRSSSELMTRIEKAAA